MWSGFLLTYLVLGIPMHAAVGIPGSQSLHTGRFAGESSSVALSGVVVRALVVRPIHDALRADRP